MPHHCFEELCDQANNTANPELKFFFRNIHFELFFYFSTTHQGNELHHNVTAGIILSDHSLALQGVSRNMAGEYTCIATNTEGRGASKGEPLRVHCKLLILFLFCLGFHFSLYRDLYTISLSGNCCCCPFEFFFLQSSQFKLISQSAFRRSGIVS